MFGLALAQNATVNDGESAQIDKCSANHIDETLIPGRAGSSVATSVHSKLISKLFIQDRGFMLGYAFVETEYGYKIIDRYEMQQQIWGLTRDQFQQTKEHFMKVHVKIIDIAFGIDWESILYEEMNVPLYSGIGFHLYLLSIDAYPIAWSTDKQAELYQKITDQATIQWTTYTTRLIKLQEELCKLQETDLVFLVDESGSIGNDNFKLMMDFVSNIIGQLNIGSDTTRVALRTFSDPDKSANNDLHFSLNNFDDADLGKQAAEVKYDCDRCRTFTDTGIADVLATDFRFNAGMRTNSKKVLVVITDGESTEPLKTIEQAEILHSDSRNIQVIAIGVAGANITELEIIASTKEQVYFMDDFSTFKFVQVISPLFPVIPVNGTRYQVIYFRTRSPSQFAMRQLSQKMAPLLSD